MMHAYRSHTCAALNTAHVGHEVRLSGWVHRVRDHGGVLFIDLRSMRCVGRRGTMPLPNSQAGFAI